MTLQIQLDLVPTRRKTEPLEDAVETVHDPHVITVDVDFSFFRLYLEPDRTQAVVSTAVIRIRI